MKERSFVFALLAATTLLGACGNPEIVVQAQLDRETEGEVETVPIGDLRIILLPYDRDRIFDELEAAAAEPQPQIPDSILRLQQEIAEAQDSWQEAEGRWNMVRDSLRTLSDRLQNLSRASAQYRLAFAEFTQLEGEERQLRQRSEQEFGRFTALQSRLAAEGQQIRTRREEWAEEAFAAVDSVIQARLDEVRRDEETGGTNAAGVATFRVKPGQWWVHARHDLPWTELYWNIPVEAGRGDSAHVVLNRENAEERPKL